MARPKGKQIAVKCGVCGTVRHWPPSKAAGKKFCSRECQFSGQTLAGDWGQVILKITEHGYIPSDRPAAPDPQDRIRVIGDRWFLRDGDDWQELKPHPDAWVREVFGTPIDESEIPEATA